MKYGRVETEKLYFSSSEAAEQIGVPVSILHSWEKDFPELKPKKNGAGKRIYRQIDIEIAKGIKEKDSEIRQVKPVEKKPRISKPEMGNKEFLLKIRDRLRDILDKMAKSS
jgi:DNA-binding transcriptional MerR regulator